MLRLRPESQRAVWAILYLARSREAAINLPLKNYLNIVESFIQPNLHLIVNHARCSDIFLSLT